MKIIIAGSRNCGKVGKSWNYDMLVQVINNAVLEYDLNISGVISGGANGPDRAGEIWADGKSIEVTVMKTNWKLGRHAGFQNNSAMADIGDCLLALYDGESKGTKHMINLMKKLGKRVIVITC